MRNITLTIILFALAFCNSFAQKEEIKTVKIGKQVWMAKNLDVSIFRNGDPIPEAKDKSQWVFAVINKIPAFSYVNYDAKYASLGRMYNWYAVNDPRGLSPNNYHVPSDNEWNMLENYLGGRQVAGKKLKKPSSYKIGSEYSCGFDAVPLGDCEGDGGHYYVGTHSFFWTSTEADKDRAWLRFIFSSGDNVDRRANAKFDGYSVRCIKD